MMRKWLALTTIFALLTVSSVPLVSAEVCFMPGMQAMDDEQSDARGRMSALGMNQAADCFIECGCRLHSNLDSLPHLLAPHAASLSAVRAVVLVADVPATAQVVFEPRLLSFPLPPPRYI